MDTRCHQTPPFPQSPEIKNKKPHTPSFKAIEGITLHVFMRVLVTFNYAHLKVEVLLHSDNFYNIQISFGGDGGQGRGKGLHSLNSPLRE